MKKEKQITFALKIDRSKAYDRVNWSFLHLSLIQIGVPIDMVEWIMGCINSASFAVLINGSPSSFFRSSRGLRQGCPLSPFLFLLIVEALSRLLNRAREENMIKGVKVTNQIDLTHVLFVDDVLMYGEGTLNNLQNLEKILRRYQKATGMEINPEKSNLIHNNLNQDFITQAKSLIPVSISQIDEGFKYLGFHLKLNGYRKEDWIWLVERIQRIFGSWFYRWLSLCGRLVLVSSILQSILVY